MKINAKLTLLFDRDGMKIEIHDDDAAIQFVSLRLNSKQTCQVMSRLAFTDVAKAEVYGLDRVGMRMEHKPFKFEVGLSDDVWNNQRAIAKEKIKQVCPDGWEADTNFSFRDSFFSEGDVRWARTNIRRWVPIE